MRNKTFILTLFSFLVLVSCEDNPLIPPVKTETKLRGAFIVNEGNFYRPMVLFRFIVLKIIRSRIIFSNPLTNAIWAMW